MAHSKGKTTPSRLNARVWSMMATAFVAGFIISLVLCLITFKNSPVGFISACAVLALCMIGVLLSRVMVVVEGRWEFAHGYTTLRAYSKRYEYRGPGSKADPALRPWRASGSPSAKTNLAGKPVNSPSIPASNSQVRTRRRLQTAVAIVSCFVLVGIIRLAILYTTDSNRVVAAVIAAALGLVLAFAVVIVIDVGRGIAYTARIGNVDEGALFLVAPTPETIRTMINRLPIDQVPDTLALVVDAKGLRLWTVRRNPRLLLSVDVASLTALELAKSTYAPSRPLIQISEGDVPKILLAPRRNSMPMLGVRGSRATETIDLIKHHLQPDT